MFCRAYILSLFAVVFCLHHLPSAMAQNDRPLLTAQRRAILFMNTEDYDQRKGASQRARTTSDIPKILQNFDADAWVAALAEAEVQAVWLCAKNRRGNFFYPTETGHVLEDLAERDLLGELVQKFSAAGIVPMCFYYVPDERIKAGHPEWCYQSPAALRGEAPGEIGNPCAYAEPYGDIVIADICQIVRSYPVRAVRLFGASATGGDWLSPNEAKMYQEKFGFEFPGRDKLDDAQRRAFIQWRQGLIRDFLQKANEKIKAISPDILFVTEGAAFADVGDFIVSDPGEFGGGLGAVEAAASRNAQLGASFLNEVQLSLVSSNYIMAGRGLDGFRAEASAVCAAGAAYSAMVEMRYDGSILKNQLRILQTAGRELAKSSKAIGEAEPIRHAGILRSESTLLFRPGQEERQRHLLEFEGWTKAVSSSGYIWDCLDERSLSAEKLSQYKVLLLPNVSCMSSQNAELLKQYVRDGGSLIITGETSLFDETGTRLPDLQLAEVAGIKFQKELQGTHPYTVIPNRENPIDLISIKLGHCIVQAEPETEVLGNAHPNFRGVPVGRAAPAIVRHSFEKGQCLYVAGLAGLSYASDGHYSSKEMMQNLIRIIAEPSLVRCDGAPSVRIYAHRRQGGFVISLVNGLPEAEQNFSQPRVEDVNDMPQIYGATLWISEADAARVNRAYRVADDKELEFSRDEKGCRISVPPFDVNSVIVIEMEEKRP